MSKEQCELRDDELDLITGGSERIYANIQLGLNPSHSYGVASDTFGRDLSFQQANDLLQRFNAPTRDALYNDGNNPNASQGMISRPGARDLDSPLDWGGNVALEHGDGYARNTTIDFQHPLQGTITRNLVVDLHEGGGYQVLTLGRGENGAQLATIGGEIVGRAIGGPAGAIIGGILGQNASHLVNPELGHIAFSQVDAAMQAKANGTPNPNLDAPAGRGVEAGYTWSALTEGYNTATGQGATAYGNSEQQHTVYELAKTLNEQGSVDGYFMRSSVQPGVYHMTPQGSRYYELENGRIVEKQVDEFAGLDAAIARQAELNAGRPQTAPSGDIVVPELRLDPPGLPPELAPRDNGTPQGPPNDTVIAPNDRPIPGQDSPTPLNGGGGNNGVPDHVSPDPVNGGGGNNGVPDHVSPDRISGDGGNQGDADRDGGSVDYAGDSVDYGGSTGFGESSFA